MQRPRDELLAGSRVAGDQHRGMGLRETSDGAEHLLHRGRLPEDLGSLDVLGGGLDLALALLERAAHQPHRVIDVEGLGKVFERSALKGGHRAFQVRVRRHDYDRRGRQARLQLLHELQPGESRHANVAHHDLRDLLGEFVDGLLRGAERAMRDALARERLLEHPADRAVVIDDPHRIDGIAARVHEWASAPAPRTGSRITKRVRPRSLSYSISPWCWLTKLCASDKPSPA